MLFGMAIVVWSREIKKLLEDRNTTFPAKENAQTLRLNTSFFPDIDLGHAATPGKLTILHLRVAALPTPQSLHYLTTPHDQVIFPRI